MKYFYNLNQWIKKKIRYWLFDDEYFMGADYGYHDSALVIIRRNRKTGEMTIIQDTTMKNKVEQDFILEASHLVKRYNMADNNVVRDFPYGDKFI